MAFDKAKSLSKPKTEGKAKKEKSVVEIANIKQYAHLVALQKAVKGAIAALEGTLKEDSMEMFLDYACLTGAKPESVDAVEDEARVNIQFRKRATTSPFSVDELRNFAESLKVKVDHIESGSEDEAAEIVAALEKAKYPIAANVKTQKLYAIDPDLMHDEKLMTRVEETLKKAGLGNVITVQEEVKTYVASDDLVRLACQKKNKDLIRPLAVLAFKPTLTEIDAKALLKTASEVLDVSLSVEGDEKKVEEKVREQAQARSVKTKAKKVLEKKVLEKA